MSLAESITDRLSGMVAGKLPEEAQTRVAALFSTRGIDPGADVYDRIRLARYIVTGREDEPEQDPLEVTTMAGEKIPMRPKFYPYPEGDVQVLGPGIFASTDAPVEDTVINWQGVNFLPEREDEPTTEPDEEIAPGLPSLKTEPAPTSGEGWQGRLR